MRSGYRFSPIIRFGKIKCPGITFKTHDINAIFNLPHTSSVNFKRTVEANNSTEDDNVAMLIEYHTRPNKQMAPNVFGTALHYHP